MWNEDLVYVLINEMNYIWLCTVICVESERGTLVESKLHIVICEQTTQYFPKETVQVHSAHFQNKTEVVH